MNQKIKTLAKKETPIIKGKMHHTIRFEGGREVIKRTLAICDANLLGKVFEEGELILDLAKYKSFYDGENLSEMQIGKMLGENTSINLVGKNTIKIAGKFIKINKSSIKDIGGVPHLQIYLV